MNPIRKLKSPKSGMLIDFTILKKIIREQIISKQVHSLIINEKIPNDNLDELEQIYKRHNVVHFNPLLKI